MTRTFPTLLTAAIFVTLTTFMLTSCDDDDEETTTTTSTSSTTTTNNDTSDDSQSDTSTSTDDDATEVVYSAVDLGLSVCWATFNVGATKPYVFGDYFQWGETSAPDDLDYSSDYCRLFGVDLLDSLALSDIAGNDAYDAATANWGAPWRMPTYDEWQDLRDECTWQWTDDYQSSGIPGQIVSANDTSIFLPAAGYYFVDMSDECLNDSIVGCYWSATPNSDDTTYAYYLSFGSSTPSLSGNNYRYLGQSVRPVCDVE